jgi:site-specific DNA recombinase
MLSGASLDRPALQELLDDVRARNVDIIVVYKADRLLISVLGCKPLPSVAR